MTDLEQTAKRARASAAVVATLSTDLKNALLLEIADGIASNLPAIKKANDADLAAARDAGLADAKVRRLTLTDSAINQMADGLRQVARLNDPVGGVTREYDVPSGLHIRKVRCPIGVILMIYEARPNVTIDAFALCFKSGNVCILKGGREATHSNRALLDLITTALSNHGISTDVVSLITSSDREEMKSLLRMSNEIDLVIPRGGTELIRFVHEHARIPMVQHFQGVCHVFVDETADLAKALKICTTGKTSAPAACNATEAILVHEKIAAKFVPQLISEMSKLGVEVRGDAAVAQLVPPVTRAADDDWGREFLDLIVAVKVVPDLSAAIAHIHRFGSNHTEAIVSENVANQQRFVREIHSSCTMVNASTRFNDGYQLGLGAEIGISTSKIHAYGPMGLEELTTQRYVVEGAGQTR